MSYFSNVKIGDRVWDFERGFGKVIAIWNDSFTVQFKNYDYLRITYTFDGVKYECYKCRQTLFWDEIKFEKPQKHKKIKLKENKYIIEPTFDEIQAECKSRARKLGFCRNDKETAEKALKQIKKFARLLALRDQECPDSRGYEFVRDEYNYYICFDKLLGGYFVGSKTKPFICTVYFKTKEDAQKICDILNTGKFNL